MSYPSHSRPPSAEERSGMVALSKRIAEAYNPGMKTTNVRSEMPGGRLHMPGAIQARIQRQQGVPVTAKPWVHRVTRYEHHAPVLVWILVDVSGSMGALEEPAAVTRWTLAHAVHRVQGKVGTILYGYNPYPIQRPGAPPSSAVVPWSATDGTEVPAEALAVAESDTPFITDDSYTRWVVWFSDFRYGNRDECNAVRYAHELGKRNGLNTLAVVPDESDGPAAYDLGIDNVILLDRTSAKNNALAIGKTIAAAV